MTEEKGDSPHYSIDGAGKEDTKEPEEFFVSLGEIPTLVLKPTQSYRQIRFLFFWGMILLTLWCSYYVVIPVLSTGDYASVKLNTSLSSKLKGTILSMLYVPMMLYWIPCILLPGYLNTGTFCFYSNRLEMIPNLLFGRKVVIPYKEMYVRLRKGGNGLAITRHSTPSWAHPLQRYKVLCWQMLPIGGLGLAPPQKLYGVEIGAPKSSWENPEDVPKAVQILRERAFEFKEG